MQEETSLAALKEYQDVVEERPVFANPDAKLLCVAIASVYRPAQTYLQQSIASLLTRIPLNYQDKVRITLYNMDQPPSRHKVARALNGTIAIEALSYLTVDPEAGELDRSRVKVKEFLDYIAILQRESTRECENYLVLEDDILAAVGWADKIFKMLEEISGKNEDYALVKLMSVLAFQEATWCFTCPRDLFWMLFISLTSASVIYIVTMIGSKWLNARKRIKLDTSIANPPPERRYWGRMSRFNLISFLVLFGGVLSWVIVADRIVFVREGHGLHEREIGAMYVAVLYSKDALLRWTDYLKGVYFDSKQNGAQLKPKDLYVDRFVKEQEKQTGRKWRPMVFTPNLFQHIGIASSIGNNRTLKTARISYTFPDDDVPVQFDPGYLYS